MDKKDLPLGFGFALALKPEAMQKFSLLTDAERDAVLQKAKSASSKDEMQALVDNLTAQI